MSELADESDSKSDGKPCGFDPHYPHSCGRCTLHSASAAFFNRSFNKLPKLIRNFERFSGYMFKESLIKDAAIASDA